MTATLGQEPAPPIQRGPRETRPQDETEPTGDVLAGISLAEITPQLSRQLELPANTRGVLVTDVDETSRAAEAGLNPGDVIQEVNRRAVSSIADLERAVDRSRGPLLLLLQREGARIYVALNR